MHVCNLLEFQIYSNHTLSQNPIYLLTVQNEFGWSTSNKHFNDVLMFRIIKLWKAPPNTLSEYNVHYREYGYLQ